jgi:hypothetical protein
MADLVHQLDFPGYWGIVDSERRRTDETYSLGGNTGGNINDPYVQHNWGMGRPRTVGTRTTHRFQSGAIEAVQERPRMKSRHMIVGTMLVLVSGTAASAEWLSIGRSPDRKIEVFVDLSSIRAERNIRRASTKYDYAKQTREVAGHDPAKWIDYSLAQKAFNCAEEMSKTEAVTLYFEDGATESVPAETNPEPWKPVVPETLVYAELKFVCS